MSNRLDPDQDRHSVGPGLGPNCLQRLSVDDESGCFLSSSLRRLILPIPVILEKRIKVSYPENKYNN